MVSSLLQLLKLSYGSSPQGPGLKAGMATSWWWKEEVEVKQPSWHWNRVGAGRGRQAEPGPAGWLEEELGPAGWLEEELGPAGWLEAEPGPAGWLEEEPGPAGWLEEEPGPAGWLEQLQELHVLEGPW